MSNGEKVKQDKGKKGKGKKLYTKKDFRVQWAVETFRGISNLMKRGGVYKEQACEIVIRFSDWLEAGSEPDYAETEGLEPYAENMLREWCADRREKYKNHIKGYQTHSAPDSTPDDGGGVSAPDDGGGVSAPCSFSDMRKLCVSIGATEDFARRAHEGLTKSGWVDEKGRPINNLAYYLKAAWNAEQRALAAQPDEPRAVVFSEADL